MQGTASAYFVKWSIMTKTWLWPLSVMHIFCDISAPPRWNQTTRLIVKEIATSLDHWPVGMTGTMLPTSHMHFSFQATQSASGSSDTLCRSSDGPSGHATWKIVLSDRVTCIGLCLLLFSCKPQSRPYSNITSPPSAWSTVSGYSNCLLPGHLCLVNHFLSTFSGCLSCAHLSAPLVGPRVCISHSSISSWPSSD